MQEHLKSLRSVKKERVLAQAQRINPRNVKECYSDALLRSYVISAAS